MSKPLSWGLPPEKVCQKLKKKDVQICDLRYGNISGYCFIYECMRVYTRKFRFIYKANFIYVNILNVYDAEYDSKKYKVDAL